MTQKTELSRSETPGFLWIPSCLLIELGPKGSKFKRHDYKVVHPSYSASKGQNC